MWTHTSAHTCICTDWYIQSYTHAYKLACMHLQVGTDAYTHTYTHKHSPLATFVGYIMLMAKEN